MCNGKFAIGDIARIVKEVATTATTATELNDSSKQILLHQVKRLESIPQTQETGQALSRPFPVELRKQRKGYEGKMLTYVETIYYIDKLNEVFNHQWNFEILQEIITEVEVIVKGWHVNLEDQGAFGGCSLFSGIKVFLQVENPEPDKHYYDLQLDNDKFCSYQTDNLHHV